jgi:NADH:quinone reductase (non-electrogenic)
MTPARFVEQGGLQYVDYAELAAAVGSAGGLQIINALTQPDAERLLQEIKRTRSLTGNLQSQSRLSSLR